MDTKYLKTGVKVKVVSIESTAGMLIDPEILSLRCLGAIGVLKNYVPGHGGDVWFVEQSNGVAAYAYTELERAE